MKPIEIVVIFIAIFIVILPIAIHFIYKDKKCDGVCSKCSRSCKK